MSSAIYIVTYFICITQHNIHIRVYYTDMWDRTITLSSCGKTFSITGWQVGWMVGPAKYITPIHNIIPCIQFCASTPIQAALTLALQQAREPYEGYTTYYEWLRSQFHSKRHVLEQALLTVGIEPLPSNGGFFLLARLPLGQLTKKYTTDSITTGSGSMSSSISKETYDWKYCRMLAEEYGVCGIPSSPFFPADSAYARKIGPMARFAICKRDETLESAAAKLRLMAASRVLVSGKAGVTIHKQ